MNFPDPEDKYDYLGQAYTSTMKRWNWWYDLYIAMAVTFTISLVLLIVMAILIYLYYDSVPRPPPLQPLRVIQPVTVGHRIEPLQGAF